MGAAESHLGTQKPTEFDEEREYFSAKLIVGDSAEVLRPITLYKEESDDGEATATSAFYCAEPGVPFSIKVSLLRPPPEGVAYGARVYVESGAPDAVYTSAGPEALDDAEIDEDVDSAKMDHFFWLGPGETTYTIKGFYNDAATSWPFVFGSAARALGGSGAKANAAGERPEKRPRSSDMTSASASAKAVGCIRVQFAPVLKWTKPRKMPAVARRASLPSDAAEIADTKGSHVVAKAAKTAADDELPAAAREAVLSPKILHECRVYYNDFAGYRKQSTVGRAMLDPATFQGLPFSALRAPDVRRRCIETFLRCLQREGADAASTRRIWSWSRGAVEVEDAAPCEQNGKIEVARVADFVHANLSPAASRIICAGKDAEDDNYGEQLYQRFQGLTDEARVRDLAANKKALLQYFQSKPDLYQCEVVSAAGWFGGVKALRAPEYAELVIE